MAKAGRPPKLDSPRPAARNGPGPQTLLRRSGVAGVRDQPAAEPLRRLIDSLAAGDAAALGGLAPFEDLTLDEVRRSIREVWGTTLDPPAIDPALTLEGARIAGARLGRAAAAGTPLCIAAASPASLLPLLQHLATLARSAGAEVQDEPDTGWATIDGRRNRYLRWLEGVAVVTDGESLHRALGPAAAEELLFNLPRRPGLVVGDGPFVRAALAGGIEVVAFAGLDQAVLGVAARRGLGVTLVPLDTRRAPRAYAPVRAALEEGFALPGSQGTGG